MSTKHYKERILPERETRLATRTAFAQKVYDVVRTIPRGSVMTYQDVAEAAGHPLAYRAVGNILNKNRDPQVPCHRVVRSDGLVGGYGMGGSERKVVRLRNEGVAIRNGALA